MSTRRVAAQLIVLSIRLSIGMSLGSLLVASPDAFAQMSGPGGHVPIPPAELEQRLTSEAIEIKTVKGAGGGVTGAKKVGLAFSSDDLALSIKWKPVPPKGDGWNNSPRRELVAYQIQKWFLEPQDYVVPTSVAICIPFDSYKVINPNPTANIRDFPCVLGVASVWLDNVTVPDVLHDPERFESDPRYAYHLSNMNVLAYLIKHQDGRSGNFLTATNESDRRVFAVDNGISFGVWVHNFLVKNWHRIRVSGLRQEVIDRLRALGDKEIDALETVVELGADSSRILRNRDASANLEPNKGARISEDGIQLGLTAREIQGVRDRLQSLLADVEAGEIRTF